MAAKTTPRSKAADGREARLKAALKANLSRRKAQARAREDKNRAAEPPKEQGNG